MQDAQLLTQLIADTVDLDIGRFHTAVIVSDRSKVRYAITRIQEPGVVIRWASFLSTYEDFTLFTESLSPKSESEIMARKLFKIGNPRFEGTPYILGVILLDGESSYVYTGGDSKDLGTWEFIFKNVAYQLITTFEGIAFPNSLDMAN